MRSWSSGCFPASPDEVFDAWTTPSRMAAWMSPVGAADAEMDLRVGGSFPRGDLDRLKDISERGEVVE